MMVLSWNRNLEYRNSGTDGAGIAMREPSGRGKITMTTKHWDEMTARERDAWAAENVMGLPMKWFHCWRDPECGSLVVDDPRSPIGAFGAGNHPCYFSPSLDSGCFDDPTYWDPCENYSTDPAADYAVLVHVRENWGDHSWGDRFCHFMDAMNTVWQNRRDTHPDFGDQEGWSCYLPGDYTHAAWLAMNEENDNG